MAKINLQRTSFTNKNLKSTQYSLYWIIFEGCGVLCSSLGNIFLLFRPKNPRSRSRWMCSYFMKKSRFLHGLSTLQSVLIYDHGLRSYSWMTEKMTVMEWFLLHRTKIERSPPKISLEQKYFFFHHPKWSQVPCVQPASRSKFIDLPYWTTDCYLWAAS